MHVRTVKQYPLIFFFIALFIFGWKQRCFSRQVNERYLHFLPGYAYQEGRDVGMSPLLYCGSNFTGNLGLEIRTVKSINRIDVSGTIGRMIPPTQPKDFRSIVKAKRLQLDYAYLHIVKKWKQETLQLYVGGVWNILANTRYHTGYVNNAWNYDFSTSLGGTIALLYNFKIKKKSFAFYTDIELPVAAFNIRPAYASSIPEGFIAREGGKARGIF